MLNNFDYLWKRLLCVCGCVNSTFGRCCHCPCWKEEALYFTKIDKADKDENIKKCFNDTWYNAYEDKVLLLKEADENGPNVLSVTGSGDKWEITDSKENVLVNAGCKPDNNKWIIVEITTWDSTNKKAGGSFVFYVDDIKMVVSEKFSYGVFEQIECYSIKIIAANTSAVKSMKFMFYSVISALERDGEGDTGPGLIGLDKLNVENVEDIGSMFCMTIRKQATLNQLREWRFSKSSVRVTKLFYSTVKGLNFTVLNGWSNSTYGGAFYFWQNQNWGENSVFVDIKGKEFTPPSWHGEIREVG